MKSLGYGAEYAYNPAYIHPVINTYLPLELKGEEYLLQDGDESEKMWDEEQLRRWEMEVNGGLPWSGRNASSSAASNGTAHDGAHPVEKRLPH